MSLIPFAPFIDFAAKSALPTTERFVAGADEKLTAFLELESQAHRA